jgi:uncharacterized protein
MTTTERRREIASMGGKAAHAQGKAHEFKKGSELARAAGRKAGAIHAAKMAEQRRAREQTNEAVSESMFDDEARERA